MSLARVNGFTLDGVLARRVWVEADVRKGLPAFTIVGLADKAVREARERVRAAITNGGFVFPDGRITISLAPAALRKVGPGFDLPVAVAILAATGELDAAVLAGYAIAGELSLGGDVRSRPRRARDRRVRAGPRHRPPGRPACAGPGGGARARARRRPGRGPARDDRDPARRPRARGGARAGAATTPRRSPTSRTSPTCAATTG